MKKLIVLLGVSLALFSFINLSENKGELIAIEELESLSEKGDDYKIDVNETIVKWTGRKAFTHSEHNGTIKVKEGTFGVGNGLIISGDVSIDMTTIANEDISSSSMKTKLVNHLKSPDFFDVEKYPVSKLKILKLEGKDIIADVTVKGTTEKIKFPIDYKVDGNVLNAKAKFTFDRSKFNVRYGSDTFFDNLGNKTIDNNIDIEITLVAKKQ